MTLPRLVLIFCLAAFLSTSTQASDDPARLDTANRIYDRVFPDEAAMIDYVLPYVPQDNPNAKNTAADIIRRLGKSWLHDAFVSSLALAYNIRCLNWKRMSASSRRPRGWPSGGKPRSSTAPSTNCWKCA